MADLDTDFSPFTYDHDGLTLAGRIYGTLDGARLPLVCLPGLTRNSRDFHALAKLVLASNHRRPLIAFDLRGRGRSDPAASSEDYTVAREAADVMAGLAKLKVRRAVCLGTSRGALIIHFLAKIAPGLMAGAVLNDAGPRIEAAGLRDIHALLSPPRSFEDWPSLAAHLEKLYAPTFPALKRRDFEQLAWATHRLRDGRIVPDCDPRIAEGLNGIDPDTDLPEFWALFDILASIPLMVIRGELSTLLTAGTVEKMRARSPGLETTTVKGQGHAPFLETGSLPDTILDFADAVDQRDRAP